MTQIRHGDTSDLVERFLGQKGLVRGDEHVGEAEQAAEFIVLQQAVLGVILKEDAASSSQTSRAKPPK